MTSFHHHCKTNTTVVTTVPSLFLAAPHEQNGSGTSIPFPSFMPHSDFLLLLQQHFVPHLFSPLTLYHCWSYSGNPQSTHTSLGLTLIHAMGSTLMYCLTYYLALVPTSLCKGKTNVYLHIHMWKRNSHGYKVTLPLPCLVSQLSVAFPVCAVSHHNSWCLSTPWGCQPAGFHSTT